MLSLSPTDTTVEVFAKFMIDLWFNGPNFVEQTLGSTETLECEATNNRFRENKRHCLRRSALISLL